MRPIVAAIWLSLLLAILFGCSLRERPDPAAQSPTAACDSIVDRAHDQRDQAVDRAKTASLFALQLLAERDSARDELARWRSKALRAAHDTTWIRLKVHEDGIVGEIVDTTWVINSWDER